MKATNVVLYPLRSSRTVYGAYHDKVVLSCSMPSGTGVIICSKLPYKIITAKLINEKSWSIIL